MKVFLPSPAATLGVSAFLLVLTSSASTAQTPSAGSPGAALEPAATYFVSQTSLGTPFQVDADYVRGQVNYQKANAALYEYEIANGTDPDLKAFARQTPPKIQDHLGRALKLQTGYSDGKM